MTDLKDILLRQISATGPITLADYMSTCLMHPDHGYYQRERVFGAGGDFITAPEVHQMFGEMIGLWLADRWIAMGKPVSFLLVECGPGRGTLMADIVRTMTRVPGMGEAADIHFIETSAQLRDMQAAKVPQATWHDDMSSLPEGPVLLVANEFFDALPIHQFVWHGNSWLEHRIGETGGELRQVAAPVTGAVSLVPDRLSRVAGKGAVAEVSPATISATATLCKALKRHGGAALIIDYGYYPAALGDTFQALEKHEYVGPFEKPGKADLTAHVDFEAIQRVAKGTGLTCPAPAGQGEFLMALGIGARAEALAAGKSETDQDKILSALRRLTAPDQMGTLFKVLAIQSPDLPPAPGVQP